MTYILPDDHGEFEVFVSCDFFEVFSQLFQFFGDEGRDEAVINGDDATVLCVWAAEWLFGLAPFLLDAVNVFRRYKPFRCFN